MATARMPRDGGYLCQLRVSARLHQQDFYELLAGTYLKIRNHRGIDDVYELFGRNLSGADLHVVYRVLPGNGLRVFI
jgi:hypothetical protein